MKIKNYINEILITVLAVISTSVCFVSEAKEVSVRFNNLAPLSMPIDISDLNENDFRKYLQNGGAVERKLQVVVPVSHELYNGNLIRLINSLANQTVINGNNYEVVVVVNNTRAISDNPLNPTFIENQLTLQMLDYLKGNTDKTDFLNGLSNASQIMFTSLFEKMQQKKFNIRSIDLSSKGAEEFNIGRIRNTAVQELISEYQESDTNTIIAMMDADCTCPENYAENILVNFITYEAESLLLGMNYEVIEGFNADHFKNIYADRYPSYWIFYTYFMQNDAPWAGSPQIVASASAFEQVGGVPEFERAEDLWLASNLYYEGLLYFDFNTIVNVSDRVKKDGFGASKSRHAQMQEKSQPLFRDPLINMMHKAFAVIYKSRDTAVQDIFNKFIGEINPQYLSQWQDYYSQEKLLENNSYHADIEDQYNHSLFRKDLKELPTYIYLKEVLPKNEFTVFENFLEELKAQHLNRRKKLIDYAKTIFNRYLHNQPLLSEGDSFELLEFFHNNNWIIAEANNIMTNLAREGQADFQGVLSYLETEFPNYFAPYEKAYAKQHAHLLFALEKYFLEAEVNPEEMPKSNWIFDVFQLFFNKNVLNSGIACFNQSA